MAVDFDKFDKMVNQEEVKKQMETTPEFDDVPHGIYDCDIEKMEIKTTKAGDKLMFSVQLGITETVNAPKNQNKRKIFWNRVICGNKTTDRWNDGVAIKGVITWVEKLLEEGDTIEFKNYSQFAEEILNVYQDVCPEVSVRVEYDPSAFNPIDIREVFDK